MQADEIFSAVHARGLEHRGVVELALDKRVHERLARRLRAGPEIPQRDRQRLHEHIVEICIGGVEDGDVDGEILNAAAQHLEHRLAQLVERGGVVEPHGDALAAPLRQKRLKKRRQHLRGVVPSADAIFVVSDADEARIFERVEMPERHVSRVRSSRIFGSLMM